jgi:apolipoprotein N-acyltransferase
MSTAQRLVVAMGGMFAVAGVLEPHVAHPGTTLSPVGTAHTLVMAVLLFAWCKADAAARGIRPPPAAPLLVALIAIVGVPYYFFRVLPTARAALAAIGKALLFFVLLLVVYAACFLLSTKLTELHHA